jgi:TolB-like protein
LVLLPALTVVAAASQLGVMGLSAVDVPPARAALYTEHLATRLVERGYKVVTPNDMAAIIGLERQKQLLACNDSSCLAELAAALGVGYLVTGQIAHVDDGFRVVVKLLDQTNGAVLLAQSVSARNENAVFTRLDEAAAEIDAKLKELEGRSRPTAGHSKLALVPLLTGVAAGLAGGALLVSAKVQYDALYRRGADALMLTDAVSARDNGSTQQTIGFVLVGVAAACVVAGVIWFLLSGSP